MSIIPTPLKRGDSIHKLEGNLIGTIGACSDGCVSGDTHKTPLEVILVQGGPDKRIMKAAESDHVLFEGNVSDATVSFTLEAFTSSREGDPLSYLAHDSATFKSSPKGSLRDFVFNETAKNNIHGGLIYVAGISENIYTWCHDNPSRLDETSKIIRHITTPCKIEGWGNYSLVDGADPYIHIHGTYEENGVLKGGHFIMDDQTQCLVNDSNLLIYPMENKLIRTIQSESFPTWFV